jgi:hypothetical protein
MRLKNAFVRSLKATDKVEKKNDCVVEINCTLGLNLNKSVFYA